MKHYTTIAQSKKLLELGLNPETSDMIYTMVNGRSTPFIRLEKINELDELHDVPCWSLGALLEVMPKWDDYKPFIGKKECYYTNDDNEIYHREIGAPIEAAYSMVIWLLENNYLKTEK